LNHRSGLRQDRGLRAQLIEFDVLHELAVADPEPLPVFAMNIDGEHASLEFSPDLLLKGSKQQTSIGFAFFPHHPLAPIGCPPILSGTNRELKRSELKSPEMDKTLKYWTEVSLFWSEVAKFRENSLEMNQSHEKSPEMPKTAPKSPKVDSV
jgi:hypothetical protein